MGLLLSARPARGCLSCGLFHRISLFNLGQSRYAIRIHRGGRETHPLLTEAIAMQRNGDLEFVGRRDGIPVYVDPPPLGVYWWNGSDHSPTAMHKPGEVVS